MQMAFVVISGYVVAMSPPAAKLIRRLASLPGSGPGAVAFVAAVSMLSSLLNWGFSLIFSGLLVRELARRSDLGIDYRAAGAAAYLGLGATWALGLSSSAAQLQANPASLPKSLMQITGIIPFSDTIFLWQSMALCGILIVVSTTIAWLSAPTRAQTVTAKELGVDIQTAVPTLPPRERPSEWLEYSPLITLLIVALAAGWIWQEFSSKSPILAISNLNTYNFSVPDDWASPALAAPELPQFGGQCRAGDDRGPDPVPALRCDCHHPDDGGGIWRSHRSRIGSRRPSSA